MEESSRSGSTLRSSETREGKEEDKKFFFQTALKAGLEKTSICTLEKTRQPLNKFDFHSAENYVALLNLIELLGFNSYL